MNRKTGVIAVLLLMSILLISNGPLIKAQTGPIYIRADGSIDPSTAPIQRNGNIYALTGNISSDADGIVIERDNIEIDGMGYALQRTGTSGMYYGISVTKRSNVTIQNINIIGFAYAILLNSSSYNSVTDNNLTNNLSLGIWLNYSSSNSITSNNITNNNRGIQLMYSSSNSITGNNITDKGIGVLPSCLQLGFSSYNNITGNNLTDTRGLGIWFMVSSYNKITGNNLMKNAYGFLLGDSSYNSITGNNITKSLAFGILLSNSSYNTLRDNQMIGNRYNFGFEVDPEMQYELSGFINDVDGSNTVDGKPIYYWISRQDEVVPADAGYVAIVNSTGITVKNLDLKNNVEGILLAYTKNSTITGNNMTNNERYGIYLTNSSYNSITGNNITSIYGAIALHSSSNNKVYQNNIEGSTYADEESINIWDDGYPSGGNYWSNYTGTDSCTGPFQNETGSDGIGDVPYVIDNNNIDHYPLMQPWIQVANHDVVVSNVVTEKTVIGQGFSSNITVDVFNKGEFYETFNITAYCCNGTLTSEQWNIFGRLGDVDRDGYITQIDVDTVASYFGKTVPPAPSSVDLNGDGKVDMKDVGACAKNFGKQIWKYFLPAIERQTIENLTGGDSATLTVRWNTTDLTYGNYTLIVVVDPVTNETYVAYNNFTIWATVTIPGDINGDFQAQLKDLVLLANAYGSTPLMPQKWNANADVNGNGMVDLADLVLLANHYNQHYP